MLEPSCFLEIKMFKIIFLKCINKYMQNITISFISPLLDNAAHHSLYGPF